VPVFNVTESNARFTISPLGVTATKLAYWDEEAFVSELVVSSVTSKLVSPANENHSRSASDRAAASVENEGLLKSGKENEAKAKKRKAEANDMNKPKKVSIFDFFEMLY
jgi:transglutaminase/protease-like cytokinesis protein 3